VAGSGLSVPSGVLRFDFPVMIAVALACLPVFRTGSSISRREGIVFIAYYLLYAIYLGLNSSNHPFQREFGLVVVGLILPLTLVVAAAIGWGPSLARRRGQAFGLVNGGKNEPAEDEEDQDRGHSGTL